MKNEKSDEMLLKELQEYIKLMEEKKELLRKKEEEMLRPYLDILDEIDNSVDLEYKKVKLIF